MLGLGSTFKTALILIGLIAIYGYYTDTNINVILSKAFNLVSDMFDILKPIAINLLDSSKQLLNKISN